MSIYLPIEVSTLLADVIQTLRHDQHGPSAEHDGLDAPCAPCALLARAQQLAALRSDPDAPLFAALEAAGAGDAVSNTVDHLEETILLIAPCMLVDPRAMLRAVIVTAQQRLDWGYGPIGGAHAGAPPPRGDQTAGVPEDGAADSGCDTELSAALEAAAVAVEIEADIVAELRPAIEKAHAVRLIVQRLRDNGWTL